MKQFLRRLFAFIFAFMICFSFIINVSADDDPFRIYEGFDQKSGTYIHPVTIHVSLDCSMGLNVGTEHYFPSYTVPFTGFYRNGIPSNYVDDFYDFSSEFSNAATNSMFSGLSFLLTDFPVVNLSQVVNSDVVPFPSDAIISASGQLSVLYDLTFVYQPATSIMRDTFIDCLRFSASDFYFWSDETSLSNYIGYQVDPETVQENCEIAISVPTSYLVNTGLMAPYVTICYSVFNSENPDDKLYSTLSYDSIGVYTQNNIEYALFTVDWSVLVGNAPGVGYVYDFNVYFPQNTQVASNTVRYTYSNLIFDYEFVPFLRTNFPVDTYKEPYELVDYAGWLGTAVGGFFDLEILEGFTLGGIFITVVAFACVIWFLKIFAGG